MIIAVWVTAALCVALWSVVAWGMHAVLTIDPLWVGSLAPLADRVPGSAMLSYWVPGWPQLVHASLAMTQAALAWVGAAAPVVVIVTWLIGSLVLLGGAIVLTMLVRLMRRRRSFAAAFAR